MRTLIEFIKEIPRSLYWGPYRLIIQHISLNFGYRIAWITGRLSYTFLYRRRKKLRDGIEFLLNGIRSSEEIESIVKKTFLNFSCNAMEVFHYPMLSKDQVMKMAEFKGLEYINEGLKKGKGVILLHGHLGNEEFLMPGIGYMGYKVTQLASRWEPEKVTGVLGILTNAIRNYAFKMRIGYREMFPVNFVYIDKSIRDVFRLLENNEVLLLAADGREGKKWFTIDFLGKNALFSRGPMSIAITSGAVVLPTFIIRSNDLRHKIVIEKPMELVLIGDHEVDVRVNIERFFKRLSEYVKEYPEQYGKVFWLDKKVFADFPSE